MDKKTPLLEALAKRVLVFDGAMGTEIQKLCPKPEDFPDGRDGFNDGLTLTHPEWILQIHKNYVLAGADCIETNTFGSNRIKLEEYGFGERTVEINRRAAQLAGDAALKSEKDCYVIGSMGPSGYLPSSDDADLGQMPLEKIREAYRLQAEGLLSGNADALLVETSQDILEVKLAVRGAQEAMDSAQTRVPLITNITLDKYGKMLLGTGIDAAYTTLSGMGIDVFGLNCSTGPEEMESSVRWLQESCTHPVIIVPNAGMPVNDGGVAKYVMNPQQMSSTLARFAAEYDKVRIVGGCCGTTPSHTAAMRQALDSDHTADM